MLRHLLTALFVVPILAPTFSHAHWWQKLKKVELPSNVCFSGDCEGSIYLKEYQYAQQKQQKKKANVQYGRWHKTWSSNLAGEFCGTTQPALADRAVVNVKRKSKSPGLTFAPIFLNGGVASICIEFDGPVALKSYVFSSCFQGVGTARLVGGEQSIAQSQGVPVEISGYLVKSKQGYRVHGKIVGSLNLGGAVNTRQQTPARYLMLDLKFAANGKYCQEPCCDQNPCEVECEEDFEAPQVSCQTVNLQCGEDSSPEAIGYPNISDNCDPNPSYEHSDSVIPGSCSGNYTITRTWTVSDSSGNVAYCEQTINVQDTIPPAIVCPPDVVLPAPGPANPELTGTATATDCTSVLITRQDVQGEPVNGVRTITRTWTAEDECGNQASCVQTIMVPVGTGASGT